MEQELSKYILNISERPNKTAKLIAIPMYKYRIQTNEFEYGLNFFQKAVLMFKVKPGISDRDIAKCLGLDERLVSIVSTELINNGLITSYGRLTPKGQSVRNEMDGPIASESNEEIGYVFQFVDTAKLYPYYIKNISYPAYKESNKTINIVIGEKKTVEEDSYAEVMIATKLLSKKQNNPVPTEKEILSAINRSAKYSKSQEVDDDEILSVKGNFSISFVPSREPETVWVCTYVWLPIIDDEGNYDTEWRVMDPFGHGNNIELKFYIEDLIRRKLFEDVSKYFSGYHTANDEKIDAFNSFLEESIEDFMCKNFSMGYQKLDANMITHIRSVVKYYILLKNIHSNDNSDAFIINIQRVFEVMFRTDNECRNYIYGLVNLNFKGTDDYKARKRKDFIKGLLKNKVITCSNPGETILKMAFRMDLSQVFSLRQYLIRLLLTYDLNRDNRLIQIIKDKIDIIFEIAEARNNSGHGHTSSQGLAYALSMDKVEKYLSEFKIIVNNFIDKYNG